MESKKRKLESYSEIQYVKTTTLDLIFQKLEKIEKKLDERKREISRKLDKVEELELMVKRLKVEKKDHQISYVS